MDPIFKRRSIRVYLDKRVEEEKIQMLLKAGMNAPSARNLKPCSFIVIDDRATFEEIMKINTHAKMLSTASHVITVCVKEASEFWPQDAAAAVENMLLEATLLDLGSCWIGVYPKPLEEDFKKLLNVPNDIRIVAFIAIGYPNEIKEPNNYYDEAIVHYNKW